MPPRAAIDPPRWAVHRSEGEAGAFHGRQVPDQPAPALWLHRVRRPALVLGSRQPDDLVDRAAADRLGMEVARRRSGGGLVLVHPDHSRWIDVVVPREHATWSDDVGRASHWLGRAWSDALRRVLPAGDAALVAHHEGAMVTTRWSRVLCFAGTGPGEVAVAGAKVVGISQRRTRGWARFQCLLVASGDHELVAPVLAPHRLPGPVEELADLPIGHPVDLDAAVAAFLDVVGP